MEGIDNCWCHKDISPEQYLKQRDIGHDSECVHEDEEISQDEEQESSVAWYDLPEHLGAGI